MRIIPAIDLRDGRCVRLAQGQKSQLTVYNEEPLRVATQFVEAGATLIHVVDLDAAFGESSSPNRDVIAEILSTGVNIEVGGGIRTRDDVEQLCALGARQVVVGTAAIETPQAVKRMLEEFGERICIGIDARNGLVMVHGWERQSSIQATDLAQTMAAYGCQRIVYTDISRDGMLTGPNVEQTLLLARAVKIRVTASGGVSSLDDIRRLCDAGEPLLDSVIVGKALYEGKFKLEQAIRIAGE